MPSHHLIIGGQRSGKSRQAERMAMGWLQQSPQHRVMVVATALACDDEMRSRIERHRAERPHGFDTVESAHALGEVLRAHAAPDRLLIVDCLTLWLTNVLMPSSVSSEASRGVSADGRGVRHDWPALRSDLLVALSDLVSPVLLVSNEIGWGVIPMGAGVRQFVDELGRLNQDVAQCCGHITLMAAGQPWTQLVQRWAP
ncbi:MAG: bifunctional adenosylcobinamide kinase/adenosylcobinamide-phosphate guanylyltransferase [Burkholderiales bacterium]|nr:bifunctional adenosylcobinamide kinase/adenosylcobinamide-phosphate guanylyltransferase [Burkholderiales bacterium]